MRHSRLRLLPLLIDPLLIRTQTARPTSITSRVGRSDARLALLDPLSQPPEGFKTGTRIRVVNLCTGSAPKVFALVPSFPRIPKKTYHGLLTSTPFAPGCAWHRGRGVVHSLDFGKCEFHRGRSEQPASELRRICQNHSTSTRHHRSTLTHKHEVMTTVSIRKFIGVGWIH